MIILNLIKMAESFLKGLENTVGKGEIARNEQFLLFPRCFQREKTGLHDLNLFQTTNFSLFQTERVCRR